MKTEYTKSAGWVEHYGHDKTTGTHGTMMREGQTDVVPASKAGVAPIHQESHPDLAYYTAHRYYEPDVAEHSGWAWAHQTVEAEHERSGGAPGRPVVHDVVPKSGSTVDMDPYTKEWGATDQASLVSNKGLNIVNTQWIPPVLSRNSGVIGHQGTLPHVNWNQFGASGEQHNWKVLE